MSHLHSIAPPPHTHTLVWHPAFETLPALGGSVEAKLTSFSSHLTAVSPAAPILKAADKCVVDAKNQLLELGLTSSELSIFLFDFPLSLSPAQPAGICQYHTHPPPVSLWQLSRPSRHHAAPPPRVAPHPHSPVRSKFHFGVCSPPSRVATR